MITPIFTSKKLEKVITKCITKTKPVDTVNRLSTIGKWNATIFYVQRKKCIIFLNSISKYNVLLTDIKAKDYGNLENLFMNSLYSQLIYDGIIISFKELEMLLGTIVFYPTDGDRSAAAFLNERLYTLEHFKERHGVLENMDIRFINYNVNDRLYESPANRRKYVTGREELVKLLASI